MSDPKDNTFPDLTATQRAVFDRARRQIAARRYEGREYPQQVAPWHRDEYAVLARRVK